MMEMALPVPIPSPAQPAPVTMATLPSKDREGGSEDSRSLRRADVENDASYLENEFFCETESERTLGVNEQL